MVIEQVKKCKVVAFVKLVLYNGASRGDRTLT